MTTRQLHSVVRVLSLLCIALVFLQISVRSAHAQAPRVTLPGHIPFEAIQHAVPMGQVPPAQTISMAMVLPLHDQVGQDDLLNGLYDPNDPRYGHYLTVSEFTARFAPTQADYDAIVAFAASKGLTITGLHPNRTVVDVQGTASAINAAFNVRLQHYRAADGRIFHAPDVDPSVPAALVGRLMGIVGLHNAAVYHAHNRPALFAPLLGSGQYGGYTPSDIKTAYNLNTTLNGAGRTLGLYELAGYTPSDVTHYEQAFNLPLLNPTNILVDGASLTPGVGADEVTLDIELQLALAPAANAIRVYIGPNTNQGAVDTYNKIATDNMAKEISTSWGLYESGNTTADLNAENNIFRQMAMQGQSIFAAAGDSGAYDDGSSLSVDDPASQPYVCGVGGTQLLTNGAGGTWRSETVWADNSTGSGGGGGISQVWPIPSYQSTPGVINAASSLGSTSSRNVPDVSLNADPNTGYSIYYKGAWTVYGGTSCAAPLWAAFTALVNQQRTTNNLPALGFANPAIYQIGLAANYNSDFHDIGRGITQNNPTNFFYPIITGYDDATGWGSFNGLNLLADLAPGQPTLPAAPTNLTAAGANSQVTLTWTAPAGAAGYNLYRSTVSKGEGSTPYVRALTPTSVNGNLVTYVDAGVTNGTTYFYTVTATNGAGESPASNEASATPQAPQAVLASLTINPSSVIGGNGNSATGTVTLTNPAPAGGAVVTLSSNSGAATVQANVTLIQGATTATFPIPTSVVTASTTATVSATYGVTKTASLTVQPTGTPTLLTLKPLADSYIRAGVYYTGNNYGTQPQIIVETAANNNTSTSNRAGYLQFDLTQVNFTPTAATLTLTVNSSSFPYNGTETVNFYDVPDFFAGTTTPWTETGLTYNNAPGLNTATFTSAGTLIASQSVALKQGTFTIDLTAYVKAHAGQIVTLQLIDPTVESKAVYINTREAASGAPTLTIH